MSGRNPACGANPSQSGMPSAAAIQTAPTAANRRASPTAPGAGRACMGSAALLAEEVAVETFLVGDERLERLPGDGRLGGDVLADIRLVLRRGHGLGDHPRPVLDGRIGRALGHRHAPPHLEVRSVYALR